MVELPERDTAANSVVGGALRITASQIARAPGRRVELGPHEVNEFAPALAAALRQAALQLVVECEDKSPIADWTRPTTKVDVAARRTGDDIPLIAIETKAWDIGHQLFDLAKVTSLLAAGVGAGFLACIAYRSPDFDSKPGRELFPVAGGMTVVVHVADLIARHAAEWKHHVGKGGPEPTAVPTEISVLSVMDEASVPAYPGNVLRAVRVTVTDPAPIPLAEGWPRI